MKFAGFHPLTLHFPANFRHDTKEITAEEPTERFIPSRTNENDRFGAWPG